MENISIVTICSESILIEFLAKASMPWYFSFKAFKTLL